MSTEEVKKEDTAEHPVEQERPATTIAISIDLAVGIEKYLSTRPVSEVVSGWSGIKQALDEAGVKR